MRSRWCGPIFSCVMIRRLPLHGPLAVGMVEDQAHHQLRQRPSRLFGQRLPRRRLTGLRIARAGKQIELVCLGFVRHGPLPDSRRESPMLRSNPLESVRKVYVFKHSFLSIRRIDAMRRKARAVLVRFSKSFARRRHLPSHAKVLSTTHLLGMTSKPVAVSDRLTISVSRLGKIFFCACSNIGPWYPPSAKSFFRNGNLPNKVPRTRMPPSRSWILAGWTTA